MKWLLKVILQKSISTLPNSHNLNYLLQKYITKNFPLTNKKFLKKKVDAAYKHFNFFLKYWRNDNISKAHFYEFGAGWELSIPLIFSLLGIQSQTIIDIRRNIHSELIGDAIKKIFKFSNIIEDKFNMSLNKKLLENLNLKDINENTLADLGLRYLAPLNAKDTKFPENSFDFISNTATLEHISKEDILDILKECNRILKPYGIMSCIIDLQDHYSYFDNSITIYNFLRYSEKFWKLINSSVHYQNRLRSNDYIEYMKVANFKILHIEKDRPTEEDLNILKQMPLDKRFCDRDLYDDIGTKSMTVVLQNLK